MDEKTEWTMPDWMEKYRSHFTNTGGNTVEQCYNWKGNAFANMPMAMLSSCVIAQVGLLLRLKDAGLIEAPATFG